MVRPERGPVRHDYTAANGFDGWCYVRIYAPTEASGGLPVVILTDADGPSVTNTVEQLAAEVLYRYLPQQDGAVPPFVLVEHYPDRQPRGAEARWHNPYMGETFDLVTFDSWRLRPGFLRVPDGVRPFLRVGVSIWQHADRAAVERLIGGELDWPACTCQLAAREGAGV